MRELGNIEGTVTPAMDRNNRTSGADITEEQSQLEALATVDTGVKPVIHITSSIQ